MLRTHSLFLHCRTGKSPRVCFPVWSAKPPEIPVPADRSPVKEEEEKTAGGVMPEGSDVLVPLKGLVHDRERHAQLFLDAPEQRRRGLLGEKGIDLVVQLETYFG